MWRIQEMTSRLPEDPSYWERLTDRVVTNAGSQLGEYRNAASRPWHGLARFSVPLTIGAATAVIERLDCELLFHTTIVRSA